MRGSTDAGSLQRDATGTQTRNLAEKETSRRRVQGREEMKMRETDMPIEEKRAQGIGGVTKKELGEKRGMEKKGNETSC